MTQSGLSRGLIVAIAVLTLVGCAPLPPTTTPTPSAPAPSAPQTVPTTVEELVALIKAQPGVISAGWGLDSYDPTLQGLVIEVGDDITRAEIESLMHVIWDNDDEVDQIGNSAGVIVAPSAPEGVLAEFNAIPSQELTYLLDGWEAANTAVPGVAGMDLASAIPGLFLSAGTDTSAYRPILEALGPGGALEEFMSADDVSVEALTEHDGEECVLLFAGRAMTAAEVEGLAALVEDGVGGQQVCALLSHSTFGLSVGAVYPVGTWDESDELLEQTIDLLLSHGVVLAQ